VHGTFLFRFFPLSFLQKDASSSGLNFICFEDDDESHSQIDLLIVQIGSFRLSYVDNFLKNKIKIILF
jgi:hypothetical protein